MVTDFIAVPDWFAHENVDGGIAVGDIDHDGRPDLVVFMIDAPDGPNAGYYRVGHAVDGSGAATGGWSPWHRVPDWPFWENAGGGVALADLSGDGALDLVIFIVDAPEGPNIGYVRVGRGLAADGAVTGGWGPWQQVPDWPFWENAGADCAVADVNGDGVPELVLLLVDAPVGRNIGLYRSASLGPDGTVNGWRPWSAVPDWRFTENGGAGVAVADLDGDGTPDLLVLAIDNAPGRNAAYCKVGWPLDDCGVPANGWGPWSPVPNWVFYENQGAAAALADLDGDGVVELVVLAVGEPGGTNAGLYRVLPGPRRPGFQPG